MTSQAEPEHNALREQRRPAAFRARPPALACAGYFPGAFNNAYDEYRGDPRQEEIAFRVAWAAVKKRYQKVGDYWLPIT
jgi:cation transport regulator